MALHRSADNKRSQMELTQDIHIALYGDGNGKPGLMLKVDRLETWVYRALPKGIAILITTVASTCGFVWWVTSTFSHK